MVTSVQHFAGGWAEVFTPPGIPTDGSQKYPLLVFV